MLRKRLGWFLQQMQRQELMAMAEAGTYVQDLSVTVSA